MASLIHVMNFDFANTGVSDMENTTFFHEMLFSSTPYPSANNTITHSPGGYSLYMPYGDGGDNVYQAYVTQIRTLPNILVGVAYIYFPNVNEAGFTADEIVFRIDVTAGTAISFMMNHDTKKIYAQSSANYADYVVPSAQWVRLDFKVDTSTGTTYINFKVDGIAGPQTTITQTATTMPYYTMQVHYLSKYYDDIVLSNSASDYPFGNGADIYTTNYFPNGDGTHNNASNVMENPSGGDIDGTTNLAYVWLDDTPPWVQGWGGTDYIKQTTVGSTNYAEVKFATTSITNTWILGVACYLEHWSSSNNNIGDAWGGTIIRDSNGVESEIWGKQGATRSYNIQSATGTRVECVDTPSGGWTATKVNDLRCRMGYRDATGSYTPWWMALYLTVVWYDGNTSDSKSAYMEGHAHPIEPASDITVGNWLNESSGTTLYPSLADDSDSTYAWYNQAAINEYFEIGLETPAGTPEGTHVLNWFAKKLAGINSITFKCELKQGASTVIVDDTQTISDTTLHMFNKLLTTAQVANITDYSTLRIRITITNIT